MIYSTTKIRNNLSELTINLETVNPIDFLGYNNSRLKLLKRAYSKLNIVARGNKLIVLGNEEEQKRFEESVLSIIQLQERTGKITDQQVEDILFGKAALPAELPKFQENVLVHGNTGKLIRARTPNQKKLVELSEQNDILFAIGPAGTGKTYTAVALAVRALKNKWVKKIILTRPAVEAGESLGFLPGDLKDKVDPYLRPLYDALEDMIPADKLMFYMTNRTIEVAPLAYMRGRTLDNAFMILDEAQNASSLQLKMFLTRIGPNAKCIITGDLTQIDLPRHHLSGLKNTIEILKNIKGIGTIYLNKEDVLRHRLVKEIISAFESSSDDKNTENEEKPHSVQPKRKSKKE
ncbi:MAG: PhoH family protein [Chitinophagales bacterium]|nr:PhoH family protein [Chitinophagales bacterium]